jgi:hypothetical protein
VKAFLYQLDVVMVDVEGLCRGLIRGGVLPVEEPAGEGGGWWWWEQEVGFRGAGFMGGFGFLGYASGFCGCEDTGINFGYFIALFLLLLAPRPLNDGLLDLVGQPTPMGKEPKLIARGQGHPLLPILKGKRYPELLQLIPKPTLTLNLHMLIQPLFCPRLLISRHGNPLQRHIELFVVHFAVVPGVLFEDFDEFCCF